MRTYSGKTDFWKSLWKKSSRGYQGRKQSFFKGISGAGPLIHQRLERKGVGNIKVHQKTSGQSYCSEKRDEKKKWNCHRGPEISISWAYCLVRLTSGDRSWQRNLDQGYKTMTQLDQYEVFMEGTVTGEFGISKNMKKRVSSGYAMVSGCLIGQCP